jgi:purine-binding chemotaxis protein CheW
LASPLEWAAARARLAAAQASLVAIDEPGADALREILHARALTLATPKAEPAPAEIAEVIVFRLGGQRYAIVAREALESIAISEITALPGVPDFYRGLISHRGTIYPLLDIRPLIGEPFEGGEPPARAMLFLSDAAAVAIVADAVDGFVQIDTATIVSAAVAGGGEAAVAIRGVTTDAIVVLDIWVLLADARLVLDDRSAHV